MLLLDYIDYTSTSSGIAGTRYYCEGCDTYKGMPCRGILDKADQQTEYVCGTCGNTAWTTGTCVITNEQHPFTCDIGNIYMT